MNATVILETYRGHRIEARVPDYEHDGKRVDICTRHPKATKVFYKQVYPPFFFKGWRPRAFEKRIRAAFAEAKRFIDSYEDGTPVTWEDRTYAILNSIADETKNGLARAIRNAKESDK